MVAALPARRVLQGTVLVVANPAAAGITATMVDRIADRLRQHAPQVTVAWTTRAGEARDLAAAAAGGGQVELVVAVGGDGTVQEVSHGVATGATAEPPIVLALPAGGGNSSVLAWWGRAGWPEILDAALDQQRSAVRGIDLLHLVEPDIVAALGASSGFLAAVLAGARNKPGPRGLDRYHAAAADVLAAMPADPTVVRVDGTTIHDARTCLAAVGGGRHRAQLYQFLPESVLDDGLLDVCVIGELNDAAVAEVALLVLSGEHLQHPAVSYARGRRVTIERTDGLPLLAEYDGDVWEEAGPRLTVDVLPGALRVLGSFESEPAVAVSGRSMLASSQA